MIALSNPIEDYFAQSRTLQIEEYRILATAPCSHIDLMGCPDDVFPASIVLWNLDPPLQEEVVAFADHLSDCNSRQSTLYLTLITSFVGDHEWAQKHCCSSWSDYLAVESFPSVSAFEIVFQSPPVSLAGYLRSDGQSERAVANYRVGRSGGSSDIERVARLYVS